MDIVLVASVFGAGVLSFFSPCVLPLFPVYASILAGEQGGRVVRVGRCQVAVRPVVNTLAFVMGLSVVFFLLAYAASFLGRVLYVPWVKGLLGGVIIVLGLHQMEVFQWRALLRQRTFQLETKSRSTVWRSFLLGVSFSFGWTPCIGPVLGSVLALVAAQAESGWLIALYVLGLSVPFLVLSVAASVVGQYFHRAKACLPLLKKIGGLVIIGMGLYTLFR